MKNLMETALKRWANEFGIEVFKEVASENIIYFAGFEDDFIFIVRKFDDRLWHTEKDDFRNKYTWQIDQHNMHTLQETLRKFALDHFDDIVNNSGGLRDRPYNYVLAYNILPVGAVVFLDLENNHEVERVQAMVSLNKDREKVFVLESNDVIEDSSIFFYHKKIVEISLKELASDEAL